MALLVGVGFGMKRGTRTASPILLRSISRKTARIVLRGRVFAERLLRHLFVRLPALFVFLLKLGVELLGFVGEGLHEAGVADFAHEEVVEVAGWVLGAKLE